MAKNKALASLTPYGLTTAMSLNRLEYDFAGSWRERLMMRMWEQMNRTDRQNRPIVMMTMHDCVPECKTEVMVTPFDNPHTYQVPSEAELKHISSTMQWLGTNVGFNFIDEYVKIVHRLWKLPIKERQKAFEEEIKKFGCMP